MDEIVVYRQLEKEDVFKISTLMLNETGSRLLSRDIGLALTESVMIHLQKEGFDKEWGARPMRRAVQQIIDDNVASAVLDGTIAEGDDALVDFDIEEQRVIVTKLEDKGALVCYQYGPEVVEKKVVDVIHNKAPTTKVPVTTNKVELV